MSTLAQLVSELEEEVPANDGVPSSSQYQRAIKEAVVDFGRQVPRMLLTKIAVVAGQDEYELPAGFQGIIQLASLHSPNGVIHNSAGYLVPSGLLPPEEQVTVSGMTLILYPTPTYTLERELLYKAGYPYDQDTDSFTGLSPDHESVVLLKARALALRTVAVSLQRKGFDYQVGDVRVSRKGAYDGYITEAADMERDYAKACKDITGYIGRRAGFAGVR